MKLLLTNALETAVTAAKASGALMRKNFHSAKKINTEIQHDIKLELDVRCQKLIEKTVVAAHPDIPVLGEEGNVGDIGLPYRWVVDPIDGTVNFAYGIPHACVSIALQKRVAGKAGTEVDPTGRDFESVVGVVYDPFVDELWTATKSGPAKLNGRKISVSSKTKLREAIITMGFSKYKWSMDAMLPVFNQLIPRVRKMRVMGSAALALTYVASGRMDAFLESGINLWDIAAGGLILERAGGEFWNQPLKGRPFAFELIANNGNIRRPIQKLVRGNAGK